MCRSPSGSRGRGTQGREREEPFVAVEGFADHPAGEHRAPLFLPLPRILMGATDHRSPDCPLDSARD